MSSLFITISAMLLVQAPALLGQKVDLRNYVIGGYDANSNETRVAQERARRYWQKNGKRFGEKVRYLAIEAAQQSVSLNQLINLKLEAPLEMASTSD